MQDPSTVRDIRIKSPLGTTAGLFMLSAGDTVERVESVGEASRACTLIGVVVRDTVCSATPALGGGEGVEMSLSGPTPSLTETRLTNVTAIGGYAGISVAANESTALTINATNTIASGGEFDVVALSFVPTAPVAVNLSHSNFETFETEATGAHVTAPTAAGNQSATPLFVDAAAADYREQESSPTRLAGDLGVVLPGEVDLAGNPRITNCAGTVGVDIGAYQFECPAPLVVTPTASGGSTTTVAPPSPPPAPPKPILSKLALKPDKFTVTGKAPKGTTISFRLSAAASVKLKVLGKKTVNGKRKTVTLGALSKLSGKVGANSVKFNGKLNDKPLDPGKYTLRAIASGAGGSSVPATATFTVLAATA